MEEVEEVEEVEAVAARHLLPLELEQRRDRLDRAQDRRDRADDDGVGGEHGGEPLEAVDHLRLAERRHIGAVTRNVLQCLQRETSDVRVVGAARPRALEQHFERAHPHQIRLHL